MKYIIVLFVLLVGVWFFCARGNESVTPLEDFGMYTGALSSWLTRHTPPCTPLPPQQKKREGLHSLNNRMPELSGYVEYDENNRFQTPRHHIPTSSPEVANFIRKD